MTAPPSRNPSKINTYTNSRNCKFLKRIAKTQALYQQHLQKNRKSTGESSFPAPNHSRRAQRRRSSLTTSHKSRLTEHESQVTAQGSRVKEHSATSLLVARPLALPARSVVRS